MIEYADFAESKVTNDKFVSSEIRYLGENDRHNRVIEFKAQDNFSTNDIVTVNNNIASQKLLINYGKVVRDKKNDCFTISLSFTAVKEDSLAKARAAFFGKYFMYDMNHHDVM